MNKTKLNAKRRMMFIQKEDYNFLAYNVLLLLNTLDCTSQTKRFQDFRKVAYLIDFINEGGEPEKFNQQRLIDIYINAQIKKKLLHHLIIVFKNKNMIDISINKKTDSFDIWLIKENIPETFFGKDYFEKEINNILLLKNLTRSLRSVNIKTLVNRIFEENNILTWEI